MPDQHVRRPADADDCAGCELTGRRDFLRTAGLMAAELLSVGVRPERLYAMPWRFGAATAARDDERTYPFPTADGATIDKENAVIVARYQGRVYAMSLTCPHQNTALHWLPDENRFQCPKHKSKYQPDGIFISGRATRSMDRFALRHDGNSVVVDLDKLYREDKQKPEWDAASVPA